MDHDFGGYATKANRKCSDGRTISPQAFAHMDKKRVPLVWQHGHNNVENVLGHADLEHRPDGVYSRCYFNGTPNGKHAKMMVEHGDLNMLSIYANKIVEKNKLVLHGNIHEVSLVLSGANPEARIDYVRVAHSDDDIETLDDEAIMVFGEPIEHGEVKTEETDVLEHKTYQDVYDTLDEEQLGLVEFMVSEALKQKPIEHSDKSDDSDKSSDDNDDDQSESGDKDLAHKEGTMTRNVFDQNATKGVMHDSITAAMGVTLSHSQIKTIWDDAKKMGSFKDAILAHAEDYGITNIEMLFPDARAINDRPEFITRRREWVEGVMSKTKKLPWSKIKSLHADLTHEEARAKGYIKGNVKKEQFFSITKRETLPQTIYKKQKLDRDDIIDITDFDVVAWLWVEIYFMLREEFARAVLVGDGREIDDPDKIFEDKIRPIAHDNVFYTDVINVSANITPTGLVEAVMRGRDNYRGSNPTAYMTNAVMVDMLLEKDGLGRRLYETKEQLARALMVDDIVEVPVMAGVQRDGGTVLIILVNLSDYAVGATKGGELTKFDFFDIDLNQYKYLLEGRASGALQSYKTAQVVVRGSGTQIVTTNVIPTFNSSTGVVTIPTVTGVTYKNQLTGVTIPAGAMDALDPGESVSVKAFADSGYYFPHNYDNDWTFVRPNP